ncbi:MAG: hypothetical protein Q4D76_16435 [Oscillospiraceae bacterium]|nr:hypothetical protein [Oscillospiraceae bacterium]
MAEYEYTKNDIENIEKLAKAIVSSINQDLESIEKTDDNLNEKLESIKKILG